MSVVGQGDSEPLLLAPKPKKQGRMRTVFQRSPLLIVVAGRILSQSLGLVRYIYSVLVIILRI